MFLTPWIVLAILAGDCSRALWLCFLAGSSDGVDGFLARRFSWQSRVGAYLDPIADKLLLVSVYLSLGASGIVPAALVWLVVGRDVIILAMAGAGIFLTSIRDFPPTVWGKISTIVQIGTAVVLLASCVSWGPAQSVQQFAIWSAAVATAWSAVHYIWTGVCTWYRVRR
jgi:cardiolipin synthase